MLPPASSNFNLIPSKTKMDKERAKFILQSFRPDGADAKDPAFTEALALAAENRELGDWLAAERRQDAAFAAMLSDVEIPEDLRAAIFDVLEGHISADESFDADFIGALASMKPPSGLRDQILGAMEMEKKVVEMPTKKKKGGVIRTFKWVTSAAAVIAIMGAVMVFFVGAGGNALAGTTPQEVEYSAIEMLESPFFALDLRNDRQKAIFEWLNGKDLPKPTSEDLPKGLRGLEGVGCKFLEIGERKSRASLICFKKNDDTVHLVMMKNEAIAADDVAEIQGAVTKCRQCDKDSEWAVTNWADAEHTYLLLSKMDTKELAGLF